MLPCATYQLRYSRFVYFPFFFSIISVSVHSGQIQHLQNTSKTWAVFSKIVETIPLFAAHLRLFHNPSNWTGTSAAEQSPFALVCFLLISPWFYQELVPILVYFLMWLCFSCPWSLFIRCRVWASLFVCFTRHASWFQQASKDFSITIICKQ